MNLKSLIKKVVCIMTAFMLFACLLFPLQFTATALKITNPVTVKMTSLGIALKNINITINGSYIIDENNTGLQIGSVFNVSTVGTGLKISNSNVSYSFGTSFFLSKQDTSVIGIKIRSSLLNRDLNYLGNMKFVNENGNIVVYNYVDIETYLYGVVSQEMGNSFSLEALKAQAIAARTYAYNKSFSLTDDTTTQAYIGYEATWTKCIQAVDDTKGMVLTYGGSIVNAFYSASNGGYTERTDYWWTAYYAYYQVVRDDSDYRSTRNTYKKVFKFPKIISTSTPIEPQIKTLLSTPIVNGLNALGYINTSSYTITKFISLVTNTPPNSKYPIDSPVHTKGTLTMELSVTNNSGGLDNILLTVNINLSDLCRAYGIYYNYRIYEESYDTNYLYTTGRGTPHGIGLSQYGAEQRAVEGQNYLQILSFYYINTTIGYINWSSYNDSSMWYGVTKAGANFRSGPSTAYSIIKYLDVCTDFQVLQASIDGGPWYKIQLSNLQVGYVHIDNLILLQKPVLITNITVTPPVKTTYVVGENLDLTGGKISVNYDNGTLEYIDIVPNFVSGYDKNNPTLQNITVTYKGKTASFNVLVSPIGIYPTTNSLVNINQVTKQISNIEPNTSGNSLLTTIYPNGGTLRIIKLDGGIISGGNVSTGTRVQLLNLQNQVIDQLTVIIYGDIDADGNIDINDLVSIRDDLLEINKLTGIYETAGDLYGEGKITLNDLVGIMAHFSEASAISQLIR